MSTEGFYNKLLQTIFARPKFKPGLSGKKADVIITDDIYSKDLTKQQLASIDAIGLKSQGRDYKAPHANRPTPPRKHYNRSKRREDLRQIYLNKFDKQRGYPLPLRYQNASRTFDVLAAPDRRIVK